MSDDNYGPEPEVVRYLEKKAKDDEQGRIWNVHRSYEKGILNFMASSKRKGIDSLAEELDDLMKKKINRDHDFSVCSKPCGKVSKSTPHIDFYKLIESEDPWSWCYAISAFAYNSSKKTLSDATNSGPLKGNLMLSISLDDISMHNYSGKNYSDNPYLLVPRKGIKEISGKAGDC